MKRAVTYTRCSTSHHDQKPELQVESLRDYCNARQFQVIDEIVDHGFSGANSDRPGFKRLMSYCYERKVDVVVIIKFDRLFRSLRQLLNVVEELENLGVILISTKDQFDLGSANGKLFFNLMASFSQFEKDLTRERVMMGLEHAKKKGKILGRPKEYSQELILSLRDKGLSYRAIQKELGCSSWVVSEAIKTARKTFEI